MSSLRISKRVLIIIVAAVVVLGVAAGAYWYSQQPEPDPDEALRDPQTGLTPQEEQKNEQILQSVDSFNGTVQRVDVDAKQIVVAQGENSVTFAVNDKTRIGTGVDYKTITLGDLKPGAEVAVGYWKDAMLAYEVWQP